MKCTASSLSTSSCAVRRQAGGQREAIIPITHFHWVSANNIWQLINLGIPTKKGKYSSYTSYPFKTGTAWRRGVCNHTKSIHIQYVQVSVPERRLLDHGKCSDTDKLRGKSLRGVVTLKVWGYGSVVCRGTQATYGLDPEGSQRWAGLSKCLPRISITHPVPIQITTFQKTWNWFSAFFFLFALSLLTVVQMQVWEKNKSRNPEPLYITPPSFLFMGSSTLWGLPS